MRQFGGLRVILCVGLAAIAIGCADAAKTSTLQVPRADDVEPGAPLSPADVKYRESIIKGEPTYRVKLETSKGDAIIDVYHDWSPNGADRFRELVESGAFDDARFFRVLNGFMAQGGIPGDPKVAAKWKDKTIPDDRVVASNRRGFVTYAKSGRPNSRTTQFFINYGDNSRLDRDGFSPFGVVSEGLDVIESLYKEYGEGPPSGRGPNQQLVQEQGNAYLQSKYPKLDYIKKATILPDAKPAADDSKKKKT